MKTFTLLSFTILISYVHLYAYESEQREQKNLPVSHISNRMLDSSEKPIRLTASIGMSWKYPKTAENLMKKIDALIEKQSRNKVHYQATLNDKNSHLTEKQKDKIVYEIQDIDSRIAELLTSKADIERLSNDKEHVYDLDGNGRDNGAHYIMKGKDNCVIIQGSCDAQFIHEIRHISLSLQDKRGLLFNRNNLLMPVFANGSIDELHGYRAQFAFKPNSLPGFYPKYLEDVNLAYIGSIQKDDGIYAYPEIRNRVEDKGIAKSYKKIDKDSMNSPNILANVKQ